MDEQHKEMMRNLLSGKFDAQASQSVQLHAPKVEVEAVKPLLQETPAAAPSTSAPGTPAIAMAPPAELLAESLSFEIDLDCDEPPAGLEPALLEPPMTPEEHLRSALAAYLEHARSLLRSAALGSPDA
jgi:hypothetical protein